MEHSCQNSEPRKPTDSLRATWDTWHYPFSLPFFFFARRVRSRPLHFAGPKADWI